MKFTTGWSQISINLLDVTVSLIVGKVTKVLYIKSKDNHDYLHASSCYPYHCKKGILYSQAVRLKRICLETESFHIRSNDLEKWLIERGYSEWEVWKQILKARGFSRDSLMDRKNTREEQNKITFNLTYYKAFQNVIKSQQNYISWLPLMLSIKLFWKTCQ